MKRCRKCEGPVIPVFVNKKKTVYKYICPFCSEDLVIDEIYDDGIPPTFLPDHEKNRLAEKLQDLANEGKLNLREQIYLWHVFDLYNLK